MDFHEMFESWSEVVREYDPDYPIDGGRTDNEHVRPINPDDWAKEDLEGGF